MSNNPNGTGGEQQRQLPDPTGGLISAAGALGKALDSTTKPHGIGSRLFGIDVLHSEFGSLKSDLQRFVRIVEEHHDKLEKSTNAIGMLLTQVRHLEDRMHDRLAVVETRVTDKLAAAEKLAEAHAQAQDRELRAFEARMALLGDLLKARTEK